MFKIRILFLSMIIFFGVVLIVKPEICERSVAEAIIICSKVLIPSLFPFGVCMIYIIKSGITENITFLNSITERLFGLSAFPFTLMILSMLGGYPIGAKLLNEAVLDGKLTENQGKICLSFCVNAGPGFILSAVGNALLRSKSVGYILLCSHILASLVICFFSKKVITKPQKAKKIGSTADIFVNAAAEAANATISICGFVILFSVITSYIEYFSKICVYLKPLLFISEVTSAITKTNNIYLISFLLGFSGICIWCQVLSVGQNIKINILPFILSRILHGLLSTGITYILLKLFPISLPTISNGNYFHKKTFISGEALGISMLILAIIFIISISERRNSTKILEDLL